MQKISKTPAQAGTAAAHTFLPES